ncbi:DUF5666 domain-containing protein [Rhodoferax sp.]|uniref:DUF5666 domain-containing protein n=1 Tax=Rhodoferax sp. TaxID=50421 RepID=UPI002852CD8F|nr:DUF5666 domain-containing protein [Rhodoferax sp.]
MPQQPSQRLTRRSWLVLTATTLSGCGGGGLSVAALPGTGGTGSPIFSQGSIAGFGSVIINGIKFDDLQATIEIDGMTAASADLRLGMVADVVGEVGADPALGTASKIGVWSVAQGAVSQVTATGFMVAGSGKNGMSIQTDVNTVFEGAASSAQLVVGQTVTVWGLQTSSDARIWTATRVELVPVTVPFVNSGLISVSNKQVYLNGLLLNGILAASLSGGNLVRVQGTLSTDGKSVTVTGAKLLGTLAVAPQQSDVEIEGYVSSVTPPNGFVMNSLNVDTSNAQTSPAGAAITVGTRVEVYGTLAKGVLIARLVKLEDENSPSQTEISGTITTYTSVSDFVLRGQRCDATSAVFSHGSAVDLKVGAKVQLKGINDGDVLKVTSLEFDN